jgi:uncharacterized protein YidB (DUF937 family)
MGLFDAVIGAIGGQQQGAITNLVTGLLTNPESGGLAGLLDQFKSGGLGHLAESWVGTGQNLPISAEQIQSVLGSDQVRQMAAQVGIAPEALSGHLAELLPQLIDKATPGGSVPDAASLQQGLGGLLAGLLGGR